MMNDECGMMNYYFIAHARPSPIKVHGLSAIGLKNESDVKGSIKNDECGMTNDE
jgi:hypothetical protein